MNSINIFVLHFGHIQVGWAEQKAQRLFIFLVKALILVAAALIKDVWVNAAFMLC